MADNDVLKMKYKAEDRTVRLTVNVLQNGFVVKGGFYPVYFTTAEAAADEIRRVMLDTLNAAFRNQQTPSQLSEIDAAVADGMKALGRQGRQ